MATFELPDHAYLLYRKGSSSLLPFLPDTPLRFPRYLSSKTVHLLQIAQLVGQEKPVSPFHSVCNGWFLRHAGAFCSSTIPEVSTLRYVVYFLDCQCRVEIRSGSASTGAISSSRSSSVSPLFSCSTSSEPISSSSSNGIFSIGSERVGVILATFGSSR